MCTCDPDYPEGNPYYGCSECLYDQHCPEEGTKCVDRSCVAPPKPKSVPADYVRIGDRHYLIGGDELPWPQAQYECLGRSGHLAEVLSELDMTRLVRALKKANATGRYWVGASDFEEGGKFRYV